MTVALTVQVQKQHETRGRGQGWSPGPKGSWRICITHGPIERPQQWCGCRSLAQLGVDLDPTAPEAESRRKSASSSSFDGTGSDPSVVSVAANEEKDPNVGEEPLKVRVPFRLRSLRPGVYRAKAFLLDELGCSIADRSTAQSTFEVARTHTQGPSASGDP